MFNFLQSFLSGLPSTSSYEALLQDHENKYATYMEALESDEFKRYNELREFIYNPKNLKFASQQNSPVTGSNENHAQSRAELKREQKLLKQEIKQRKSEFKRLKETKIMKMYFYLKKNYAKSFAEQERWISKFYEDFSKPEIDPRWTDTQIISEKLLNGHHYSPIEDFHIFSENNVVQSGGLLKIRTKEEQKQGLAWDKTYGMVPRTFYFTSGMLTSAHTFRQVYGKFMAKVEIKQVAGTYHAFWLGVDTKKPHINVFKIEGHNLLISLYSDSTTVEKSLKYKLKNGFYIFSLLWSHEKITWFINGKRVFEMANVIDEPMYIAFSSGVYDKRASATTMYVDWVRCYRINS
ncbi:MAG: family 16 glycosylhydrolase [Prevotellaceae bacterium]|jgi:hypothetical protein|nr:family 16 glycosylhydrolase [Prevotellaceae bacterium]